MPEEPLPSGWLPPRPPAHPTSEQAPARPPGEWPRQPAGPASDQPPSSPVAVSAIGLSAAAILLLVFTAGVSYAISLTFGVVGFVLARRAQRLQRAGAPLRPGQVRAALVAASVAIGLAGLAALVWAILATQGITPTDLQEALERQAERLRRG